jgi:uncharacterized protein (DUF924 family)
LADYDSVLTFWRDAGPKAWFAKNDAFDAACRDNFLDLHFAASRGELSAWEDSAEGALALLLLLDQFPRNMFRNSAHQFATDGLARAIAKRAIARSFDKQVARELISFFYLPFEHSENAEDQELCVALTEALGDLELLKWAKLHQDIIVKFGRFPHRNAALGRETTADEQRFLDQGGFAG